MSFILIRRQGDLERCTLCPREVEIFSKEVAHAQFLIVALSDPSYLGGGKCDECHHVVCVACATKTVYGSGLRRLHCPRCGNFLVGLRRAPHDVHTRGAFLKDPPDFTGSPAEVRRR